MLLDADCLCSRAEIRPSERLELTARALEAIRALGEAGHRVVIATGRPPDIAVRVWDSTAELRYIVVPQRPAGTEGWDGDRLAALVTRNSMIGTGNRAEKIRTYRAKENIAVDHRIGESVNLGVLLGGGLQPLVDALRREETARRLAAL